MADTLSDEQRQQAAEYVLGTLEGAERRAFEHALASDAALRAELVAWEERLAVLNDTTAPVQPPQRVWLGIEQAIGPSGSEPPQPAGAQARGGWWHSLAVWRGMAAAALLGLLLVALPPLLRAPAAPLPVYNVVLRDTAGQPLWLVVCDWRTREYVVTGVTAAATEQGKAHELWLLRNDDAAPISLGLLDAAAGSRPLPAGASWRTSRALAVSLEPAGGSPSGQPSGPVLSITPVPI